MILQYMFRVLHCKPPKQWERFEGSLGLWKLTGSGGPGPAAMTALQERSDEYYPLPRPKELLAFSRMLCDCSFRATELGIQMPKPRSCAHLQLHQDQERRSGFSSCYSARESQPPTGEGRLQVAVGKRVWLLGNNNNNKKTPKLYPLYLSEAQSLYKN